MKVLFPITGDPITPAHKDVVVQAQYAGMDVSVGIANSAKTTMFDTMERVGMAQQCFNVPVCLVTGATSTFARANKYAAVIRGIRPGTQMKSRWQIPIAHKESRSF